MMPQWISDIIAVAPWLGAFFLAAFAIWGLGKRIAPTVRKVTNFLDDWNGEPARPGVPQRLGVMARLDEMHHELHPNSGSSLADAVNRTEKQGKEMGEKLDAHIASCPPAPQTTINVNPGGAA